MQVWGEYWQGGMRSIQSKVARGMFLCSLLAYVPFLGRLAMIGDDLLANSIMLSAETTVQKYV